MLRYFADRYGWAPAQIGELTVAQVSAFMTPDASESKSYEAAAGRAADIRAARQKYTRRQMMELQRWGRN